MPMSAPKPCCQPGCLALVGDGSTRCAAHKVRRGAFADRTRGTRQERGYGAAWDRTRKRVMSRDCNLCQPCLRDGRTTLAVEVDHIVNKAAGGSDDDGNLQAICKRCHTEKTIHEATQVRPRR